MASTSSCAIGIKLRSKCHKTTYSQEIGLINFNAFSEREKVLLTLRTQIEDISNICYHHKQIYLTRYAMSQRKRANPFKLYKKHVRVELNWYKLSFQIFHTSHEVIFTVEIKMFRIVISILLNYFANFCSEKFFFLCVTGRLFSTHNFNISDLN